MSKITLRDLFALEAMKVILKSTFDDPANCSVSDEEAYIDSLCSGNADGSSIAAGAYAVADSMLNQRRKEKSKGADE